MIVDSLSIRFFYAQGCVRYIAALQHTPRAASRGKLPCSINNLFWRCTTISELMINEQIRDREVRLIGVNGEQLGIMSARDAMKKAEEAELDLVKIAPTAKPPVCKIIDY